VAYVAIELDDDQRRSFRRLLVVSALLHLAGLAALAWVPTVPNAVPPAAIAVNLVAAASLHPPAPTARPAARPAPKPPVPAPVVLPAEPTLPKPKPKPTPKPEARPKPKPKPEPAPEPAPVQEQDYADVMASLREEVGEEAAPEPSAEPAPTLAASRPGGAPGGQLVSPELRAWMTAARIRIKNNWVVPPSFRMASIAAEVRIEVDASGALVGDPDLVAGSGNPFYDEGVLRSIQKADPLPPPPEAGRWTFRFLSDDF
jgi:protein TonB